jgi:hypothetical protein
MAASFEQEPGFVCGLLARSIVKNAFCALSVTRRDSRTATALAWKQIIRS